MASHSNGLNTNFKNVKKETVKSLELGVGVVKKLCRQDGGGGQKIKLLSTFRVKNVNKEVDMGSLNNQPI